MNTLPFMHQTQAAPSSSRPRPTSDSNGEKGGERSSFEPAMRDAASDAREQRSQSSSVRNNSRKNSDIARQEHKQSGQEEDLAGAAVASQHNNSETRTASDGANADVPSTQVKNGSAKQDNMGKNADADTELALTDAEKKQLQKSLSAALQILKQDPAGRKIASELQDVLRSNGLIRADADEVALNKLGEGQIQKLQDVLTALKQMNEGNHLMQNLADAASLKDKLTDILEMVQQAKTQHGSKLQTVAQLKQPEIVEGFVLRAEKDKDSFNTAAKVDDPRFAALLNKTTDFASLRERQGQQNGQHADMLSPRFGGMNPQDQAQSLVQQARTQMATANGEPGKGVLEGQAQIMPGTTPASGDAAGNLMGLKGMAETAGANDNAGVDFSAAQKGATVGNTSTDPGVLTLKNGATVPNARVVDQTIQHLNLHARGDSSVVTVKLHPEELGELNIRMVMEGDQLKLQIQAQNQQVREILEQNFPRLRTAMEDQGVTVEDFQVSLGDSNAEDQAGAQSDDELSRRHETGSSTRIIDVDTDGPESADVPGKILSAGGLSVHV